MKKDVDVLYAQYVLQIIRVHTVRADSRQYAISWDYMYSILSYRREMMSLVFSLCNQKMNCSVFFK